MALASTVIGRSRAAYRKDLGRSRERLSEESLPVHGRSARAPARARQLGRTSPVSSPPTWTPAKCHEFERLRAHLAPFGSLISSS